MSMHGEVLPWERQAREGKDAYTAFLAYRDLGPRRTHEATRMRLGKGPDDLKPIERWSACWDWRLRAEAWDAHRQAERDRNARQEAAKWEQRRLQALEEGWQTCQALRARLNRSLAVPPETPSVETQVVVREAVASPEAAAKGGPSKSEDLALARLAKLVAELEWAILNEALPPPGAIDPWTATDEEMKAYLVLHPHLNHPPPR